MSNFYRPVGAVYTIGNELAWIKENIFEQHNKFEGEMLYKKLPYNMTMSNSFLANIVVTLSLEQLQNSLVYDVITNQETQPSKHGTVATGAVTSNNLFNSFIQKKKILIAYVGHHANFVWECQDKNSASTNMMKDILPVYEKYTMVAIFYKNHINELEQTLGYKLNVLWPEDLENRALIDLFIRKLRITK